MSEIDKEIQAALEQSDDQISLEALPNADTSPLNHPVVEKDIIVEQQSPEGLTDDDDQNMQDDSPDEPLDAPEQSFDEDSGNEDIDEDSDVEMPDKEARIVANSILGMFDSALALGKPFVSLAMKPEYFGDDDIIAFIDEQNERGLHAITLSKEEKALLRPPLTEVVKKSAKKISPEKQLMGLGCMIMANKVQSVIGLKKELKAAEARLMTHLKEKEHKPEILPEREQEIEHDTSTEITEVDAEIIEEKKEKKKNK